MAIGAPSPCCSILSDLKRVIRRLLLLFLLCRLSSLLLQLVNRLLRVLLIATVGLDLYNP